MESLLNLFGSSSSILSAVIVVLVVPMALTALAKASKVSAKVRNGMAWLEYGKTFKILSFVGAIIPCGLGVLWFYVSEENKSPVFFMILLFGGLILPLFLEFFFVKIGYDDSTAYCYSPWRPSRQVKFSDMGEPYFSNSMQWWVIPTRDQGKIRLQDFISGKSDLLEKLKDHKNSE